MPPIVIHWMLSSFTGWGVYGTNLALEWADAITSHEIPPGALVLDESRHARLERFLVRSRKLVDELARRPRGTSAHISLPVLQPLGNGFVAARDANDVFLRGTPSIGVIFFEDTRFSAQALEHARAYPLIITGSRWNEELLRANGIEHVRTVMQGIDPALFHPAPRTGQFRDRFVVFSGGKLEMRKGQDLVLRAFRAFAQRHSEALLVAAWHSPWSQFAHELGVPMSASGDVDLRAWVGDPQHFLDVGSIPNGKLPAVLREADVALFPNRAEGGTNLVAMEAMACGVPCILSRNTGHLDLIHLDPIVGANCYALERQKSVAGAGREGWGESDVEEIVETLEAVWRDREAAATRGLRGAETMASLSWTNQAKTLKKAVSSVR